MAGSQPRQHRCQPPLAPCRTPGVPARPSNPVLSGDWRVPLRTLALPDTEKFRHTHALAQGLAPLPSSRRALCLTGWALAAEPMWQTQSVTNALQIFLFIHSLQRPGKSFCLELCVTHFSDNFCEKETDCK